MTDKSRVGELKCWSLTPGSETVRTECGPLCNWRQASAIIRDLEDQLATAKALLVKAELPCLNCGRMRGKGDRLMTHDFKVYCDYDCAETDGEEWAQK